MQSWVLQFGLARGGSGSSDKTENKTWDCVPGHVSSSDTRRQIPRIQVLESEPAVQQRRPRHRSESRAVGVCRDQLGEVHPGNFASCLSLCIGGLVGRAMQGRASICLSLDHIVYIYIYIYISFSPSLYIIGVRGQSCEGMWGVPMRA